MTDVLPITTPMAELAAKLAEPLPPPVPEIGLHPGIHMLAYHRWGGASQSRLKVLRDKSPAHLRWLMEHPEEPTDAMRLGAAVHTCVLEPDLFGKRYVRAPEGDGRTKGVQEARRKLEQEHPGKTILKPSEWDTCFAIREAVARHPRTKHLLEGERECSAAWRDPETGVFCKARFDDVARGIGAITDLKTTVDASPFRFPVSVYTLGYHIQAAMYLDGAQALGIEADTFGIVAVEKEPPWAVAVYQLNAAAIYDGRRELRPLLATWAECERTGIWPGYSEDIVAIDLPTWAPRQIDQRTGDE